MKSPTPLSLLIGLSLLATDQATKLTLPLIESTAHLPLWASIIAVLALVGAFFRIHTSSHKIIIAAMIGTGVSNVVDRIAYGAVRDVFEIGTLFFNLADIVLISGALLLTILFFVHTYTVPPTKTGV